MTKQITRITAMMVLAMVLTVSTAMAQKGQGLASTGIYTGVESSAGRCESNMEMCYGNTFVMNSFGEWESHHLSISMDYSTSSFTSNDLIVMGGNWSMVVIRDNQYAGTLYGIIQTGGVTLINDPNGNPVSRQVQLNLLSKGGLGVFGERENLEITGVYNATTDLRSKESTGTANFAF